ncbi:MAG: helix-turn-helix domain-containing protein [Hyphomonadaceae bacterium]|nr:helix-turn-helix domain-containing protein [Hyphomonadaceae bacterium]
MARPFLHPAPEDMTLAGVLHALADPARLDILQSLRAADGCPMTCSAAAPADLPKSTQSYHYQVLREAGLIRSERRGTAVINTPRCAEIEARFPGLLAAVFAAAARDQARKA